MSDAKLGFDPFDAWRQYLIEEALNLESEYHSEYLRFGPRGAEDGVAATQRMTGVRSVPADSIGTALDTRYIQHAAIASNRSAGGGRRG